MPTLNSLCIRRFFEGCFVIDKKKEEEYISKVNPFISKHVETCASRRCKNVSGPCLFPIRKKLTPPSQKNFFGSPPPYAYRFSGHFPKIRKQKSG